MTVKQDWDKLSHMSETASMAYRKEFTKRVRRARNARGWKQQQVADFLNVPQDKYKQYEGRSLMPHYLLPTFCTLCGVDVLWLFTGTGRGPTEITPIELPKPTKRSKQRH